MHSCSSCESVKWLSFLLKSTTWNLVLVASNPYTAAFSHFWEKIKITLIWKHHQSLSCTTWNTLSMQSGERSRDEISDPMLMLVALVLNKLNFKTQNFTLDCPHCKAIHHCKLSSPHSKQQSNFLKQVLCFFPLKKDQIKMWYFIKIINLAIEPHLVHCKTSSLSAQWLQMPGSSNCTFLKNKQWCFSNKKNAPQKIFNALTMRQNFSTCFQLCQFQEASYTSYSLKLQTIFCFLRQQIHIFHDLKQRTMVNTAYPKLNMQCYIMLYLKVLSWEIFTWF